MTGSTVVGSRGAADVRHVGALVRGVASEDGRIVLQFYRIVSGV
jgi:hypothetical protein